MTFSVNAIVQGPAEGTDLVRHALEGIAQVAKESGVTITSLGSPNKLERIHGLQNVLDERLSEQRDLLYPQHLDAPDEVIQQWLWDRLNEPADNATWMHFFLEGVVRAYFEERISRDKLGDIVYGAWMNQMAQAIIHEAVELQASTDWKHWKNPKGVDRENVRVELVDIQHFATSGAIKSQLSPAEIMSHYEAKNAENHARQDGTVAGREDYVATPPAAPASQE